MADIMSECTQVYRNLLFQYFEITESQDTEKLIDGEQLLDNVHSSLKSTGKFDEVYSKFTVFRDENNVEDMFKYFWNLEENDKFLNFENIPPKKSKRLSVLLLEDGKRFMENKDFVKALDLITLSLVYAPHPDILEKDHSDESSDEESLSDLSDLSNEDGSGEDSVPQWIKTNSSENKDNLVINISSEEKIEEIYDTLSLAYASRAYVLFKLKQYDICLKDINRAMENGTPNSVIREIFDMKRKCMMILQKQQDDNMKKSMDLLENMKSSGFSSEEYLKTMKGFMEQCYENKDPSTTKSFSQSEKMYKAAMEMTETELLFAYKNPLPPKIVESNPSIPCFSSAIKVQWTPERGRHLIASRDIKPGEVLAVEKAYMWTIDTQNPLTMMNFCSTCLGRCAAPLPCPQCSKVVFCSDTCRSTGLSTFHKIECHLLPTMTELVSPVLHRIINIIAQIPYSELKTKISQCKQEEMNKPRKHHGFNDHMIYDSTDYRTIYHLEGNFSRRLLQQLIHLCAIASIAVKMLIKSNMYFVDEEGIPFEPSESDIVFVGSVCLDQLNKVLCNASMVDEYQINVSELDEDPETKKVGSGIFPAICLLNHSCNPSAQLNSYGNTAVCHSICFIPMGGDVTIAYDSTYEISEVDARRDNLMKHYLFICTCEACVGDWKIDISKKPKLSTKKLMMHIGIDSGTEMALKIQLQDIIKNFQIVILDAKRNKFPSSVHINTIKDTIEFFDKYVELPDNLYFLAQRYLISLNFDFEMSACRYIREL
ncbi:unnamed protein product [Meganyctiphanes norvegica]|uniref:Protein-lysine N-methyltransferase SMYD4 n=1 Tax=Meganyctiphanes norvegica TaxID=48144 RepID=A0AAV2PFW0_MEGNR